MQDKSDQAATAARLNPLAYQVLGVVARCPISGYDAMKALHRFRPVKVSQVYSVLSIMEAEGLVSVDDVVQHGKPNKRLNAITEKGSAVLNAWLAGPTKHPGVNDEFVRKVYSIWHAPIETRQALIQDRLAWLDDEIEYFEQMQADLQASAPGHLADPDCWEFSRSILLDRRLALYREEIRWCRSVLARLAPQSPHSKSSALDRKDQR